MAAKLKVTEEAIQITCADWLRLAYPEGGPVIWWHPPNGGKLSKAQAGIFKAMGLRKGLPDLGFAWREELVIVLAGLSRVGTLKLGSETAVRIVSRSAVFELKNATGSLSPDQRFIRDWCKALGIPWGMGRSIEDLQTFLKGVPGFPAPRGGYSLL